MKFNFTRPVCGFPGATFTYPAYIICVCLKKAKQRPDRKGSITEGCCYAAFPDQLEDLPASFRFVACYQSSGNGGSEGENCRSLDHMEDIPFIHPDLFATCLKTNFFTQKCTCYFFDMLCTCVFFLRCRFDNYAYAFVKVRK